VIPFTNVLTHFGKGLGWERISEAHIEVASFQVGCNSNDPIHGLLFGIAQYHLDVQVAPVAPSQKLQATPEKMIPAFARGCRVKKDMWSDFEPWDYFEQPVEDLRAEFGIDPK
jgi:hypothetical protein